MRGPGIAGALAIAFVAALVAHAQAPPKPADVPTFGTGTELVYVRFHVEKKGEKGAYVDAVRKDQIRVLEDGKPQTIEVLETPSMRERTIPPEVTLALDVSSSVLDAGLLDEALLKDVFFAGLSEHTKVGLCAFGGELRCLTPPTREVGALMNGFQEAVFFGRETRNQGTRLYASVADICRELGGGEKAQRALVIFSDGLDNRDGKVQEAIQAALDADVRVYAVKVSQAFQDSGQRLRRGAFGGPPNRALYDYKKWDLDQLAAETQGHAWEPGTLDRKSLTTILRSIATEISMENVLGYHPAGGGVAGRKRRVKVELVDKSLGTIRDGERTLVR